MPLNPTGRLLGVTQTLRLPIAISPTRLGGQMGESISGGGRCRGGSGVDMQGARANVVHVVVVRASSARWLCAGENAELGGGGTNATRNVIRRAGRTMRNAVMREIR